MTSARHLRGSASLNFNRVLCERWSHGNVVLLGDAAATAHFSVGSGTKLALESAIALAHYLHSETDMQAAFRRYEEERRTEVLRLQSAARNSTEWFEEVERYLHLHPVQLELFFAHPLPAHQSMKTSAHAIGPGWKAGGCGSKSRREANSPVMPGHPCSCRFVSAMSTLKNRIVVSPIAQYRAVNGCPTDWHLVHYAERAKGGAGLVITEMTCVSPEGRITPGCTGLYAPDHEVAWKRIVDFIHAETDAKVAIQFGSLWAQGLDPARVGNDGWLHCRVGNWPVMGPSPVAWSA